MEEISNNTDIFEEGMIYKIYNKIKEMLKFVFVKKWEELDLEPWDTVQWFVDNAELDEMTKRERNKFFKDYKKKKKK